MATISENLQTIKTSMSAIKQAISDRGGDVSGDISTWANTITNDAIELLKSKVVEAPVLESLESYTTVVFSRNFLGKSFEPNKIYYTTTEDAPLAPLNVFPSNWLWVNGEIPSLEQNTHYELSVVATKFGTDYIYKAVLTPFKSVE